MLDEKTKKLFLILPISLFLIASCAREISYDCWQIGFTLLLEEDGEKLIEKKTKPGDSNEEGYKRYFYPQEKIGDYVNYYPTVGPNYHGYWFNNEDKTFGFYYTDGTRGNCKKQK